MYKFLLCEPIHQKGIDYLKQFGEVTISPNVQTETLKKLVVDKDALFIRTWKLPEEVIDAGKKLKVIARQGKEMINIPVEYATKKGIAVVNAAHSNGLSVAEMAVALMLAVARNIPRGDRVMRDGTCCQPDQKSLSSICSNLGLWGVELTGKTLGIVGYGDINKSVMDICMHGFHMPVLVNSRTKKPLPEGAEWCDDMNDVFRRSDFISLGMPILPTTYHMIGEEQFRCMKPTAYLINIARGKCVDEAALIKALQEKWFAGAGLDVYEQEPPVPGNPLFELDNVVLAPHAGAITDEAMYRMAMEQVTGVMSILNGEIPPNLYNPGYEQYIQK